MIPVYNAKLSLKKEEEYLNILKSGSYSGTIELGSGPGFFKDYSGKEFEGSPILASRIVEKVIAIDKEEVALKHLSSIGIPNIECKLLSYPDEDIDIPDNYFVNVDFFSLRNFLGRRKDPQYFWNLISKIKNGIVTVPKPIRGLDKKDSIFKRTFGDISKENFEEHVLNISFQTRISVLGAQTTSSLD